MQKETFWEDRSVLVTGCTGSPRRDYFYIRDGVDACLLLAEKMNSKNIRGEAFNFSTEIPYTAREVVEKIIDMMGSDLESEILNQASNEIKDPYLSPKKAKLLLKWKSNYSLETGLNETINWYAHFPEHS